MVSVEDAESVLSRNCDPESQRDLVAWTLKIGDADAVHAYLKLYIAGGQ